jgi:hypothetical protein
MEATLRKRQQWPIGREEVRWALIEIARFTGLKVNADLLDEDERRALHALVRQATEGGGFGIEERLGRRQRTKFEKLVEKAAGLEPGTFQKERDSAALRARAAALATEARRPPRRPRWEEQGAVVLKRQWAFEWVRDGVLFVDHLGLLTLLIAQFENGESLSRHVVFEGSGDSATLVVDGRWGLVPEHLDPEGRFTGWRKLLDHLAVNHFVEVESQGPKLRIRRGTRLLDLTKARRS